MSFHRSLRRNITFVELSDELFENRPHPPPERILSSSIILKEIGYLGPNVGRYDDDLVPFRYDIQECFERVELSDGVAIESRVFSDLSAVDRSNQKECEQIRIENPLRPHRPTSPDV